MSDPIRLRILDRLASCKQCVCEIQESVAVAPNLLSYHLRVLRDAGLVETTRRGRWVDYEIASDAAGLITGALPSAVTAPQTA